MEALKGVRILDMTHVQELIILLTRSGLQLIQRAADRVNRRLAGQRT